MLTSNFTKPNKATLALWIDRSMRKTLSKAIIQVGFRATGIWPLDSTEVDYKCNPSNQINYTTEEESINEDERSTQEVDGFLFEPAAQMEIFQYLQAWGLKL